MRKLLAVSFVALLSMGMVFAQSSIEQQNPETVGADSAMSSLREVSIDKFEREGSWAVHISPDDGVIASRLFEGNPAMKEPLKHLSNKKLKAKVPQKFWKLIKETIWEHGTQEALEVLH